VRVLFWSGIFWPSIGGVEVLAAKLLPALRERGYEFIVITGRDLTDLPEEEQFKGIPVYRFPFWTALTNNDLAQVLTIRQQVTKLKRSFAPNLVHVYGFGPGVLFHLDTVKGHPVPCLVTLHGDRYKQVVGPDSLLEKTLRVATWVTGCSATVVEDTRQLTPEIIPHSSVIYNGLEVPSVSPEPLPFNPPLILCLGRLAPEKGVDLALTAFGSIAQRFSQARLLIAGDGPARADLEQQTVELGLTDVVHFIGWVPPEKVPALLNTATVVLMPSRQEGLPLVALEAAFMARPVVATRAGGLLEVVRHQQTGLLVNKEDSAGLAAALAFLLEHPETATRMGQAAQRRGQEVFSWQRYVDAYDTLCRQLIGKGRLSDSVAPSWC
jgi:glycosyltransferase involved in cell wall biosynthesis